ncbi:MAG TPA: glycosyltransferase, partial [Mycobacterium sp.]|nr:glycosyltransferase [Mycobacterium sp.]
MKFVVGVHGTRGDVEPCAAVGLELLRRGHDVRMAVPPDLVRLVESAGGTVVAFGPDSHEQVHGEFFRDIWNVRNAIGTLRESMEYATRGWAEMSRTLAALEHTPNELLKPLSLVPFTPKWLARKMEGLALGNADLPVCCSNLRDLAHVLLQIDGVDAYYGSARLFNRGITKQRVERESSELYLFSGRINGEIFISISAYQPGAENSNAYLRGLTEQALAHYG